MIRSRPAPASAAPATIILTLLIPNFGNSAATSQTPANKINRKPSSARRVPVWADIARSEFIHCILVDHLTRVEDARRGTHICRAALVDRRGSVLVLERDLHLRA